MFFPRSNQPCAFFLLSLLLVPLLVVSGCAVGPDFHKPNPGEVSTSWDAARVPPATTQPSTTTTKPVELTRWWKVFNDKELNSLIERAIAANLDLKLAASRVRQARAQYGVTAATFWPTVNADGSYTFEKEALNTSFKRPTTGLFSAGFDASWELDFFGGTRRNIETAQANIEAAVENQRDALVTLLAEVANDYVNLRGYQRQIVIAQYNIKIEKHSADLTRQRFHGGLVGKLDVADADALTATTQSQIAPLQTQVQQTIYALSILLDRPPAALDKELSTDAPIPVTPPVVPMGLPSELLRRRPDIRAAEAQVHAANAQIGYITAQLFPQISLNGGLGMQATSLKTLAQAASPFWSIGPNFTWPIFTAGSIQSNIKVQDESTMQALLTYRQTVLTALSDVESALVAYNREQEHRDALRDAVAANSEAVDLSNQLYTFGNTDYLNVLTAEASLYASENALVLSNASLTTDLIALYKALGGGWEDVPLAAGPTTRPDLQAAR